MIVARDARIESDWWHTAQILCQNFNINRGKNKAAQQPYKFHPTASRQQRHQNIEPTIQEKMTLEFLAKIGKKPQG